MLYSHRRWLKTGNFGIRKERGCTIFKAKSKALISGTVTAHMIYFFVFAYAKGRFSRDEAQFMHPIFVTKANIPDPYQTQHYADFHRGSFFSKLLNRINVTITLKLIPYSSDRLFCLIRLNWSHAIILDLSTVTR